MNEILKEVLKYVPENANIVESGFEGANIILYTKSKEFFLDNSEVIKTIVEAVKKRIELRPHESLLMEEEKAENEIKKLIPEEAGLANVIFDISRSKVIIEASKPGLAIGKSGDILKEIKRKTFWIPLVRRTPPIKSQITDKIRDVLYEHNDYRKKFLNKVGERIYGGWTNEKKDEWIRISFLGAGRQVGRSCLLLQTPESRILLDCGVDVAADNPEDSYPMLDAPEFDINKLDAIIVTHAHADHCLPPNTPVYLENGTIKPIDDIKVGDILIGIDWKTGKRVIGKCNYKKNTKHKEIYKIKTSYYTIGSSRNHKFFVIDKDLEIKEVTAENLREGMVIPCYMGQENEFKRIELKEPEYFERLELPQEAVEKLKIIRKERNWTQDYIVSHLKKHTNLISDLENKNKHIYINTLKEILGFYGIDFNDFAAKYNINKTVYPKYINEELAQVAGYMTGDGGLASERTFRITDQSTDCLKEYKNIIKNIFNYDPILKHHPDKSKNAHIIEINNAGIVKFFEDNFKGILGKNKKRDISEKIIFSSNNIIRAFLRGIADAEGSVNNCISISSSQEKILETLQHMLSTLGILSNINYKNKVVNIASSYSIKRYYNLIGFNHIDKKLKLENLVNKLRDTNLKEIIPISSIKLKEILMDAGFLGKVHKEFKISDFPAALLDRYRRKGNSYADKNTINKLIELLEERLTYLKEKNNSSISKKRKSISLPRKDIAQMIETTYGIVQNREVFDIKDKYYEMMNKKLNELIEIKILKTQDNINKLKKLVEMPVIWQKITKIEKKENPYPYLVDIEVEPNQNFVANGVVVHNSAFVPYLYKMGFKGPVYYTEPGLDIAALMALDYISVSQKENRKVIFGSADIKEMVKHSITLEYDEVTDITPDIRITFYDAGHTLGSAMVHLNIGNGLHNILYTGDMNYETSNLLSAAMTRFSRLETMIMEATYGGSNENYPSRREAEDILVDTIKKTIERGGKVLMPVLGTGRAQEIMVIIDKMIRNGMLDKIPVYVQGTVWDITAIHTAYPDFFNSNIRKMVFHKDQNPFLNEVFKRVGSRQEMQEVIQSGPCIILATSGMLVGGASVEYFKELADNPKNSLIFSSYLGRGSLGRRVMEGEKEFNLDGKQISLKMEIAAIRGFTGHSTRERLISFVRHLNPKPKRIILLHGDNSNCLDLASNLHKMFRIETNAPKNLEAIRIR